MLSEEISVLCNDLVQMSLGRNHSHEITAIVDMQNYDGKTPLVSFSQYYFMSIYDDECSTNETKTLDSLSSWDVLMTLCPLLYHYKVR